MMKRYLSPINHTQYNSSRLKDLKNPFEFCYNTIHQNPETQHDLRHPSFESSFVTTPLVTNLPDIQFRVQDNAKEPVHVPRIIGVYRDDVEIKKTAVYGRLKKGRGPLAWFIEDEIEAAQDILAEEKKAKWEEMHEKNINKRRHRNSDRASSAQDDDSTTVDMNIHKVK